MRSALPSALLAFDTSGEFLHAGLALGDSLLVRTAPGGALASRTLLPLLGDLLAEAGLRARDLDAIAFGAGPGSFTGVRTTVAVAQALGLATGAALVAVDALEALAHAACGLRPDARWIAPVIDARMGEVYFALYECRDGLLSCAVPASVAAPAVALDRLGAAAAGGWIGCGAPQLVRPDGAGIDVQCMLDAALLIAQARLGWTRGTIVAPEHAQPLYLRDKVALTTREREARALV